MKRYMALALLILLVSCSTRLSFKTEDFDSKNGVTINVDKRIQFIEIDGKKADYKGDEEYLLSINDGNHTFRIQFVKKLKDGRVVKADPLNFSLDLTARRNYTLSAEDFEDRIKKGIDSSKETFLVHYILETTGEKKQVFRSSCNTDKLSLKTVKCLVNNRENLDRRYGHNRDLALIHHLVLKDERESLKLILKNGADVNRKTRTRGFTPLHYAAEKNNIPVLKILVRNGADINRKNSNDACAIHLAAKEGSYSAVKFLKEKGAKTDLKDKSGKLPYDYAVEKYHPKTASVLKVKTEKKLRIVKKKNKIKKLKKRTKKKVKSSKKASKIKKKKVKKRVKRKRAAEVKRKKKKRKKRKRKPDEEDTLPARKNPIPSINCRSGECYASLADAIEKALKKTRYSKLEKRDLLRSAYTYFQISKLLKRTTPESSRIEFENASNLFKEMKFGKRKLSKKRIFLIRKANRHVTKAARLIVEDADRKLKKLND